MEGGTGRKVVTEVYSRVSGYFRPVAQWNPGKREEWGERKLGDVRTLNLTTVEAGYGVQE